MYEMVDGKPVLYKEVDELLNSDRTKYSKLYGADNTYWMLQDNIMQLQWKSDAPEPISQLEKWTYPYVVYNGQYDSILPTDSKEANADEKITLLWSETLPKLLLAPSDERFDAIMQDFITMRDTYGYADLIEKKTELWQQAKEKLGME